VGQVAAQIAAYDVLLVIEIIFWGDENENVTYLTAVSKNSFQTGRCCHEDLLRHSILRFHTASVSIFSYLHMNPANIF
jgi:hypothetical protein